MGRRIEIAAGYKSVVLPNGRPYDAGDEVVLSDDQWASLSSGLIGTAVTDLGAVEDSRTDLIGFMSTGWAKKVQEGKAYAAGGQADGAAGGSVSANIDNPAGSGKNVIIAGWQLATTTDVEVEYIHEGVSTGTVRPAFNFNHYFEAQPAVAVARVGSNVLTGGTTLSPIGRITSNAPVGYDFMVIIPPGHSFALSAATPGLTTFTLYVTAFWYEEPV